MHSRDDIGGLGQIMLHSRNIFNFYHSRKANDQTRASVSSAPTIFSFSHMLRDADSSNSQRKGREKENIVENKFLKLASPQ